MITMEHKTKAMESLAPVRLDEFNRETLSVYFKNTWELYEMLFSSIQEEGALYKNPDPLRHPLIFYLGHTAVFYINKLVIAGLIPESARINPHYEKIFEQGVDPAKAEELGSEAWPSEASVRNYREQAYELVLDFIQDIDYDQKVTPEHPLWSILMGLEHDRIHFETSSMLIRQYPVNWVKRPLEWEYAPTDIQPPNNDWIAVSGGGVQLGKPVDFPTFGWDNEYGRLYLEVDDFEASQNLVTNAEFLAFVHAGGYQERKYWGGAGWHWRKKCRANHPKFWVITDSGLKYRAMFDIISMPGSWPVEVNQYEAMAYCAWKGDGARLLSEGEFKVLAGSASQQPFDLPMCGSYNLNLRFGSPTPVGMCAEAGSELGFNDVWGNVWCWLNNDFYALPGYKVHPYYADFSAPYLDDEHAMLLGGSWASSGTSASKYYRLWFRRNFFQHAGFRLARNKR